MSILGLGIENPGIECPFLGRRSNVRGSNVHFGLRDRKSGDRMSIFGPEIESPGINVRGSNVHFGLKDRKFGD